MIAWDYHVILEIYGFPFEEIRIILVPSATPAMAKSLCDYSVNVPVGPTINTVIGNFHL